MVCTCTRSDPARYKCRELSTPAGARLGDMARAGGILSQDPPLVLFNCNNNYNTSFCQI